MSNFIENSTNAVPLFIGSGHRQTDNKFLIGFHLREEEIPSNTCGYAVQVCYTEGIENVDDLRLRWLDSCENVHPIEVEYNDESFVVFEIPADKVNAVNFVELYGVKDMVETLLAKGVIYV